MLSFKKPGLYVEDDPNAGDDGAGQGGSGGGDGGEGEQKLQFTQEQLNEIINRRIGEVKTKAEKAAMSKLPEGVRALLAVAEDQPELLENLTGYIEAGGAVRTKPDKDVVPKEELDRLVKQRLKPVETERDALRERIGSLMQAKKMGDLKTAIERAGAMGGTHDQVAMLVDRYVQYDEDTDSYLVVNEQGATYFNPDTSEPHTPETFVKAWLADNPHFLPASARPGTGAKGGAGAKGVGRGDTLAELDAAYMEAMEQKNFALAGAIEQKRAAIRRQTHGR